MAGATAVGVGSAVYQDIDVFGRICREMAALMAKLGYERVGEMQGAANAGCR